MMHDIGSLKKYKYRRKRKVGLLVLAGGFEERATALESRTRPGGLSVDRSILVGYRSQEDENRPNLIRIRDWLEIVSSHPPFLVSVHAGTPISSLERLAKQIVDEASQLEDRTAMVDISGMTHLLAIGAIDACVGCGLATTVVYSEARTYYPLKSMRNQLVRAWINQDYETAAKYLQSSALWDIHIPPRFAGSARSGYPTCLIVFAGYEPNRVQGLVERYAPGAVLILYGKSPHERLAWRTELSQSLHAGLLARWRVAEDDTSTIDVDQILETLEERFRDLASYYDISVFPQCSKMQGVAAYLFWKRHPEVQLVFSSPVRFNADRYSRGVGGTFEYQIPWGRPGHRLD
jgi:hypothetical protein